MIRYYYIEKIGRSAAFTNSGRHRNLGAARATNFVSVYWSEEIKTVRFVNGLYQFVILQITSV
ncbi:MAG: hypothetical protein WAM19_02165, partial [Nitrososphaeraceae archaeon]